MVRNPFEIRVGSKGMEEALFRFVRFGSKCGRPVQILSCWFEDCAAPVQDRSCWLEGREYPVRFGSKGVDS